MRDNWPALSGSCRACQCTWPWIHLLDKLISHSLLQQKDGCCAIVLILNSKRHYILFGHGFHNQKYTPCWPAWPKEYNTSRARQDSCMHWPIQAGYCQFTSHLPYAYNIQPYPRILVILANWYWIVGCKFRSCQLQKKITQFEHYAYHNAATWPSLR